MTITAGLKKGGVLIVNADDEHLCKARSNKNYKVVTFGMRRGVIKPEGLTWDENSCACFSIGRTKFQLNVPGVHNLYNALAAIAVGLAFRVPKARIASALNAFRGTSMRMDVKSANGFKIVSDCYNANPSSTKMALLTIGNMSKVNRRIAVLGDMLELGKESRNLHEQIGTMVPEANFDILVTVGEMAKFFVKGAKSRGMRSVFHFSNVQEVIDFLIDTVSEGDVLLVKGSRGMKMEQVVEALLQATPIFKE